MSQSDEENKNKVIKILLLGDSNVGKTSIFNRYYTNKFKGNYSSSIGVDFQTKNYNYKDKNYSVHIFDTAGQERFRSITESYYHMGDGIFLVFDLTNQNSLNSIPQWIESINEKVKNKKFIILGNKDDLKRNQISELDINEVLEEFNDIKYIKVSAKDGTNIQKAFEEMIDLLDDDNNEEEEDEKKNNEKPTSKLKKKNYNINDKKQMKCC